MLLVDVPGEAQDRPASSKAAGCHVPGHVFGQAPQPLLVVLLRRPVLAGQLVVAVGGVGVAVEKLLEAALVPRKLLYRFFLRFLAVAQRVFDFDHAGNRAVCVLQKGRK